MVEDVVGKVELDLGKPLKTINILISRLPTEKVWFQPASKF